MKLDEIIRKRRSIRKYNDEEISKEEILKLIEAGMWSPTATNRQAYKFIVVNRKDLIDSMIKKGSATFLKDVSLGILVIYNNQIDNVEYKDHIQSASAAIQNILLKATEINIGACWICHLPPKVYLRKLFKIPKHYDPIAFISLGKYDKEPHEVKRKRDIQELVGYNSYTIDENDKPKNWMKLRIKRIIRRLYFNLPPNSKLRKLALKYEKKFKN